MCTVGNTETAPTAASAVTLHGVGAEKRFQTQDNASFADTKTDDRILVAAADEFESNNAASNTAATGKLQLYFILFLF